MKRVLLLLVAVLVLGACTTAMSRDINLPHSFADVSVEFDEGQVDVTLADHYDVFYNMDQHPNLVRVCVDGVAVMTTTREYGDAVTLVPEWNEYCAQFVQP